MEINWTKTESQSYRGLDEYGNEYLMPASQETCKCILEDGKSGMGWTPEEAKEEAEKFGITHADKLEIVSNAIDSIIDIGSFPESDYHEFVNSEKSIVEKLRKVYNSIEEKIN